jgi:molybdate transport repressor ModE-like protein
LRCVHERYGVCAMFMNAKSQLAKRPWHGLDASSLDVRSLRLLAAVAETGSVSRAAQELSISQPSATARIQALEAQLGFRVLERGASGSRLTSQGEELLALAGPALMAWNELETGARAIAAGASPCLRVISSYTIADYLMPQWFRECEGLLKAQSLELLVANSATVLKEMSRQSVSLGFVECPEVPDELESCPVGRDELVIAVSKNHSWAGRKQLDLEELISSPILMREPGSGTRATFELALSKAMPGASIQVSGVFGSTSALKASVLQGNAAGVLSYLAVEREIQTGELMRLEVPELSLERVLHAVWPKNKKLDAVSRRLLSVAQRDWSPC